MFLYLKRVRTDKRNQSFPGKCSNKQSWAEKAQQMRHSFHQHFSTRKRLTQFEMCEANLAALSRD